MLLESGVEVDVRMRNHQTPTDKEELSDADLLTSIFILRSSEIRSLDHSGKIPGSISDEVNSANTSIRHSQHKGSVEDIRRRMGGKRWGVSVG